MAHRTGRTDYEAFRAAHREFVDQLSGLRTYRDSALSRLREMGRQQRSEVRRLLRCRRLALLYAYEGVRRSGNLRTASEASIREMASRCNPFVPCHERVHRHSVRSGGRDRLVQNYGPHKRMQQLLVADVLAALHPPRSEQYLFRGGMPKALKAIEAAYDAGFGYAVEVDFINFYGSVRLPPLAEMLYPLPTSVVEHVVWDTTCRRTAFDDITACVDHPSLTGLVGLPLGAATSPIVGERIIGLLLDRAQIGRVVTYADNLLVLGRDRSDVVARAEHLGEHARRLEASPVRLRIGEAKSFTAFIGSVDHPYFQCVDFANQRGHANRDRLEWEPSLRKQVAYCIADTDIYATPEEIDEVERQIIHWRRAYPSWRGGDAFMNDRLAELAAARYYQTATPNDFVRARDALLVAYIGHRQERDLRELLPEGATAQRRERRWRLYSATRDLVNSLADAAA